MLSHRERGLLGLNAVCRSSLERALSPWPSPGGQQLWLPDPFLSVPMAPPHISDPPNSSPQTWGLAPTQEKRLEVSGWCYSTPCRLLRGQRCLPQCHNLVQAISANVPQKRTWYPLTLLPKAHLSSAMVLAQGKCHMDLSSGVAQQLTLGPTVQSLGNPAGDVQRRTGAYQECQS